MKIDKIINSINSISLQIGFVSCDYTVRQKTIMCDSFLQIAKEFPEETEKYFFDGSRKYNLQNKIFRKYIYLLEESLPLSFKKGKEKFIISSIDDEHLNIFSQKEEFDQFVDRSGKIKNNTQQIYIGGRKASYVKPFYIGKLLDIFDLETGESLMDRVEDYTFTFIKIKDPDPGIKVRVTHLAVPPHYQMGPMVYLNRIKTEIKKNL